jgi:hypothetical protein
MRQEVADPPVLDLRIVGDGRAFFRAIARILVHHELISAGDRRDRWLQCVADPR